jgi:putative phosphoesterase
MILGVVSDSHGHVEFTRAAVRMLDSLGAETVIHCGDVGSAAVVELFRPWPTHFVFGNVDERPDALRQAIEACGLACHERFGELELCGRRIAFLHGDDSQRLRDAIECGRYDLVCSGHTHQARMLRQGPTLALNPGALYRAQPRSLAIVTLPELEVTQVAL